MGMTAEQTRDFLAEEIRVSSNVRDPRIIDGPAVSAPRAVPAAGAVVDSRDVRHGREADGRR